MMRSMRAVVVLAGLFLASADDKGTCALNGMRAVDDMLDSAIFIWAAVTRCDKGRSVYEQDAIRCSLNVASAAESLNAMVNVVLKAVEQCGGMESEHAQCGLAVGVLTRSFAGLAAGSSGIIAKCPNALNGNKPLITYAGSSGTLANPGLSGTTAFSSASTVVGATHGAPTAGLGECVVNMKDTIKSLFKAMKRVLTIHDDCEKGHESCVHNSLKLAAALASIGEYLAGTIGKCSTKAALAINAECAQESLALGQHLTNVARAGVEMKKHCGGAEARLYQLENGEIEVKGAFNSVTLGLVAALPVTAFIAFLTGSRFAKSRGQQSFESLEVVEE